MPPDLVLEKIHQGTPRERALPWILASVLFAVLIFLSLREDYWGDEGFTLRRLGAPWPQLLSPGGSAGGAPLDPFDRTQVFDLNPPIYFVLMRLALGPEAGALGVRMFSILPTIAAFLIMAWWAGRVFGRRAQWSLMIACLLSPAMLYYGHEARPYALALLFALPALCATWSAHPRAGPVFALHLFGAALGCLTNLYFLWWVIAEGIILSFFAAQPREPIGRKTALAGIGGLALGGLLASLFMLSQRALFESAKGRTRLSLTWSEIGDYFALPLSGPAGDLALIGVALQIVTLGLAAAILRRSDRRLFGEISLGLWLIPTLLPMVAHQLFEMPSYARYAYFGLPGWLMTVAWIGHHGGVASIPVRRFILPWQLAMAALCLLLWSGHLRRPIRRPWGPAIEGLRNGARAGDYYTIGSDWLNGCFAANARTPPAAAYFAPQDAPPPDARRIWLIIGEDEAIPPALGGAEGPWRLEPHVKGPGMWLWLGRRASGAAQ